MKALDFYNAICEPPTRLGDSAIDALMHLFNRVESLEEETMPADQGPARDEDVITPKDEEIERLVTAIMEAAVEIDHGRAAAALQILRDAYDVTLPFHSAALDIAHRVGVITKPAQDDKTAILQSSPTDQVLVPGDGEFQLTDLHEFFNGKEPSQDKGKPEAGDWVAVRWAGPLSSSRWETQIWGATYAEHAEYFDEVRVIERAAEVQRRLGEEKP